MMTVEKIKDLWMNRKSLSKNEHIEARVNDIYAWLDWASDFELTDSMRDQVHTAKTDGCPTDNANEVHEALLREAEEHFPGVGREAVEKTWNHLAVIQNRESDFRTSSEALATSAYENFNLRPKPYNNPDSWFFSYNYPWHIIAWMRDRAAFQLHDERDSGALDKKFILKYLWMLATPGVISILSLKSFQALLPVFKELEPNFEVEFSYHPCRDRWNQTIEDFVTKWKDLSKKLQASVFGEDATVSDGERREFSRFLFGVSLTSSTVHDGLVMLEHGNKALILYGPPGTGKTRQAEIYARKLLSLPEDGPLPGDQVKLVQFHPGYSYQDFIGGILPRLSENGLGYQKFSGIFKTLCKTACEEPDKKFVLIIDEINRADLSAVFGELLYGLEYRGKAIEIPWCGEIITFTVPNNVYLIGTMNTTDKSLVGFDLALRRRFSFLKLMPDMTALETLRVFVRQVDGREDGSDDTPVTDEVVRRAEELNKGLSEKLNLDADKQIGHAYFLKLKDFCVSRGGSQDEGASWIVNAYAMEKLWVYHIEPLLEEYLGLTLEAHKDNVAQLRRDFCGAFKTVAR